jgi:hypothetical protein
MRAGIQPAKVVLARLAKLEANLGKGNVEDVRYRLSLLGLAYVHTAGGDSAFARLFAKTRDFESAVSDGSELWASTLEMYAAGARSRKMESLFSRPGRTTIDAMVSRCSLSSIRKSGDEPKKRFNVPPSLTGYIDEVMSADRVDESEQTSSN